MANQGRVFKQGVFGGIDMEIIISSGDVLRFMIISGMFLIGVVIGYFIGKDDGRRGL